MVARKSRIANEVQAQAKQNAEVNIQEETDQALEDLVGDDMSIEDMPNAQDDLQDNPFAMMQ